MVPHKSLSTKCRKVALAQKATRFLLLYPLLPQHCYNLWLDALASTAGAMFVVRGLESEVQIGMHVMVSSISARKHSIANVVYHSN